MTVQERREEKKKQLKSIALKLFEVDSYEKTRVSTIVKQAGLSQGSFYWYFDSKEACALEILADAQQQLMRIIEQGYHKMPFTISALKQIRVDMFKQIIEFAKDEPYLMKVILIGLHSEHVIQEKIIEIKQSITYQLQQNILQIKQLTSIKQTIDVELHAMFIMSLIEGMLERILFEKYEDAGIIDNIVQQMVEFEFTGLFGH